MFNPIHICAYVGIFLYSQFQGSCLNAHIESNAKTVDIPWSAYPFVDVPWVHRPDGERTNILEIHRINTVVDYFPPL